MKDFLELENKEKALYEKLLSKNILTKQLLSKSWEELRLSDSLRNWFKQCYQILFFPTEENEINSFVKDKDYDSWIKEVSKQYRKILIHRNQIAISNLGLVNSIAFSKEFSFSLKEDLVQEGFFGLIRAIEKFDSNFGFKFSTYALFWIKESIRRFLSNRGTLIRVPVHAPSVWARVSEYERAFVKKHERLPTREETSAGTGLTTRSLANLIKPSLSVDGELKLGKISTESIDLKPISELIENYQQKENLKKIINQLPQREKQIINYRFGFSSFKEKTLQELGQDMNLSRERVRQLEVQALNKIKTALVKENKI